SCEHSPQGAWSAGDETMQITLSQFERIDGLMSSLLRMGEFETCADPRGYIATSNRLFDACVDAFGFAASDAYASALDWAAEIVAKALIGTLDVLDVEAV
ncbi:MAG: hypothetical protein V4696_12075, partial [Pseudomonadota bacterium]